MQSGITKKLRFLQLILFGKTKPAPVRRKTRTPDGALEARWKTIRAEWFPDREDLDSYSVYWSTRRQRRVLASCNIRRKLISVAQEMNDPEYFELLTPLLYHEMCHAVLGEDVQRYGSKRAWHGHEFKALEKRHPGIAVLDTWIRSGGWARAVRRHRTRSWHQRQRRAA